MRTVLTIVCLCVFCQAHVHNEFPPLSKMDRKLLDLLRITAAKKDLNSSLVPISDGLNSSVSPPEDYGWIKDELAGLQETLLFPGSHYLRELIRQHCETKTPFKQMDVTDIKDDFEFPECVVRHIWKSTFKIFNRVEDPDVVALSATRVILPAIFNERVKCPAAVLDMAIASFLLMAKKDEYMLKEEDSLYNLFKKMAPLIHPVLSPYADDLALRSVELFHGKLFNESIDFIFAYGLEDVARAQHTIFRGLRDYFDNHRSGTQYNVNSFLARIQANVLKVKCPNENRLAENHKKIVLRFRDEFEGIESERICTGAKIFLSQYVNEVIPGFVVDFEENGNLQILCETIRDHVHKLVEETRHYESFLYSMNIRDLEEMIRKAMTDAEWAILKEAVSRLGFSETR